MDGMGTSGEWNTLRTPLMSSEGAACGLSRPLSSTASHGARESAAQEAGNSGSWGEERQVRPKKQRQD